MKEWRMTKEEYLERSAELMKKGQTVDEWADFSLHPQDPKEIILRTLMTCDPAERKIDNGNWLCFSYICESNKLPPDLVDDMLFIQSGFLDYRDWNWDDDNVHMALSIMAADDPLGKIMHIATHPGEFPDFYERCIYLARDYKVKLEAKLYKTNQDLELVEKSIEKARKILNGKTWKNDYELLTKTVRELDERLDRAEKDAAIARAYNEQYKEVDDRMDWHALKKTMPKAYLKKRHKILVKRMSAYDRKREGR